MFTASRRIGFWKLFVRTEILDEVVGRLAASRLQKFSCPSFACELGKFSLSDIGNTLSSTLCHREQLSLVAVNSPKYNALRHISRAIMQAK